MNNHFLIKIKSDLPVSKFIAELDKLCIPNKSGLDILKKKQHNIVDKKDTWILHNDKEEQYYQHNS